MPLVDAVIIGGMKCGTTALHRYLADHPDVAASTPKELNFFFGDDPRSAGNWWRGPAWYAERFSGRPGLRVEASPGYTSPDHPRVAERMRRLVPGVRLLYLVREPLDRAVSQYRHHRRDGDEERAIDEALLDADSQYLSRSRHLERLRPFLERFPDHQIAVLDHRDLLTHRRRTLRAVFAWLGLRHDHWSDSYDIERNVAGWAQPTVADPLRERFTAAIRDDALCFSAVHRRLSLTSGPIRPRRGPAGSDLARHRGGDEEVA